MGTCLSRASGWGVWALKGPHDDIKGADVEDSTCDERARLSNDSHTCKNSRAFLHVLRGVAMECRLQ